MIPDIKKDLLLHLKLQTKKRVSEETESVFVYRYVSRCMVYVVYNAYIAYQSLFRGGNL